MGRPLIRELCHEARGENIYICRTCYTHITCTFMLMYVNYSPPGSGLTGGLFQHVENVQRDGLSLRHSGPHTIINVHCNLCADHLGWEFGQIDDFNSRLIRHGNCWDKADNKLQCKIRDYY